MGNNVVKCKVCEKEFEPENYRFKYCSSKCYNKSMRINTDIHETKRKAKDIIRDIRVHWDFLRTHFPKKAIELKEVMEREENPEFIELMLNGFKDIEG